MTGAPDPVAADWIAVDWGTSTLRAWAMRGGSPVDEARSAKGMGGLAPDQFEATLLECIDPWLHAPAKVIACGMVGARQGWVEAPYAMVPCPVTPAQLTPAPAKDPRLSVLIAPGVAQAEPADVMRGEETQIAGFLAQNPKFDGVLCLPGSHTKWVHISASEIVSFRSFMTGEIFALLAQHSVLRHSVRDEGWDAPAFLAAVEATLSRPERLASELFSIRAQGLLVGEAPARARSQLSGLLIGAELAAARPYWLGQQVVVIGAPEVARAYVDALRPQGVAAQAVDGDPLALVGLTALNNAHGGAA